MIRASIIDNGGVLIVSMANQIKNGDGGWWERHGRRQEVEQLEG